MPGPSLLRGLRWLVVGLAAAHVFLLQTPIFMGITFTGADPVWIWIPLACAAFGLGWLPFAGSTVRPLEPTTTESDARRNSVRMVAVVTLARLPSASLPAIAGLACSLAANGLLPAMIGAVASVLLLFCLVYPRRGVLGGLRRRLESKGVLSHLYEEFGWAGEP